MLPQDVVVNRHPVEDLEPLEDSNEYREAAKRFAFILNRALLMIMTAKSPRLAAWQVAYAVSAPVCEGVTMTDRAKTLRVTRAAMSKGAKQFQRACGLKPSSYMKSEQSTAAYSEARTRQLK